MPGVTPIYALPFQELTDPPHGPNLGGDLAQAVEDEINRIDTELTTFDGIPAILVRKDAVQAMPDSATTTISFDTVEYNNGFTFTPPNTLVTIPKTGLYVCTASLAFNNSGTSGFVQLSIGTVALARLGAFSSFAPTDITVTREARFSAGNTVSISVFHNNGASRNTFGGVTHRTQLSLRWVRG